ncbi:hypothetical protein [Gymnodinialimonas ulvae]|uniref:hypothetical protein n=1 Tax=Gymnodinialimonas ulvae TaxID=3126504 RepID=UPI0030AA4E01
MKGAATGLALFLAANSALADEFCDTLAAMQAVAGDPDARHVTVAFPDAAATEAPCRAVLELGGIRSLSCNWSFAYRAAEAQAAFEALSTAITECRGDALASDAPVNHPDTYDLLSFEGGVSAALKDKANLGETLVILRVQG